MKYFLKIPPDSVIGIYTDNTDTSKSGAPSKSLGTITGVMSNCRKLTGIATLLIGLQLFIPQIAAAKVNIIVTTDSLSSSLSIDADAKNSLKSAMETGAEQPYDPGDNGGPSTTQGGGRR
ncbi:hypothetical protein [Funiculus sociatus]|uniref:hypothetical protein n=1 Tax=Funiculus sociatus TaxID=450527 RepID=UPI0032986F74